MSFHGVLLVCFVFLFFFPWGLTHFPPPALRILVWQKGSGSGKISLTESSGGGTVGHCSHLCPSWAPTRCPLAAHWLLGRPPGDDSFTFMTLLELKSRFLKMQPEMVFWHLALLEVPDLSLIWSSEELREAWMEDRHACCAHCIFEELISTAHSSSSPTWEIFCSSASPSPWSGLSQPAPACNHLPPAGRLLPSLLPLPSPKPPLLTQIN